MRSVQDPVVPQQGHMPLLQQAKGHELEEYINEWSQSVAWPQQSGYPSENSSGEATHSGNKGDDGHETSPALGTEDRPSAGPISSRCRIRREGDASAAEGQVNFEQAQQEVMQAQTDRTCSCRKPHCQ